MDFISYIIPLIFLSFWGYFFFRMYLAFGSKTKDKTSNKQNSKYFKTKASINNDRNELDQLIKKYYYDQGMNLNVVPSQLEKKALSGNVEYMFDFANILVEPLDQGIIDKKYQQLSYYWMKKASNLGHEPALSYICLWHLTGDNILMKSDYAEGMKIYNQLKKSNDPFIIHMVNFAKDYADSDDKTELLKDAENIINNLIKRDGEAKLEFIIPAIEFTDKLISDGFVSESDRIHFTQFCVERVLGVIYPKNFNVSDSYINESYDTSVLNEIIESWKEYKDISELRDDFAQLKGKSLDEIKVMNFELYLK